MVKKRFQHQLLRLQMMTFFQVKKQQRESFKGSKVKSRGLSPSYTHTRLQQCPETIHYSGKLHLITNSLRSGPKVQPNFLKRSPGLLSPWLLGWALRDLDSSTGKQPRSSLPCVKALAFQLLFNVTSSAQERACKED